MNTDCPDAGRLRAWLDRGGPAGSAPNGLASAALTPLLATAASPTAAILDDHAVEDHLVDCDACQETLVELERDADHAAQVLTARAVATPTAAETEIALGRLHRRLQGDLAAPIPLRRGQKPSIAAETPVAPDVAGAAPTSSEPSPPAVVPTPIRRSAVPISLPWRRWRLAVGGIAAALALTFALATPEGQAVAAGFLAQFRSQRLAIVTFDPTQARQTGLFRFEQLGSVKNNQPQRPAEIANVQEAVSKAGFPVLQPDPATLPAGVARTPNVRFSPASETRLTFDKQKARTYFDSINRKDLALPEKMHGASLVVALPPIVVLEYANSENKPGVMVGQAREVQVGVDGNASLDEVRSFLLNMPNLPPELARQLRSIQDWTSTLPIPVPVDKMTWQETTVNGAPGYILNDNTGLGSGVIWQRDGRIIGVAGPLKATDLRRIAESLK